MGPCWSEYRAPTGPHPGMHSERCPIGLRTQWTPVDWGFVRSNQGGLMRRALIAVTAVCLLVALAAPVSAGQAALAKGLRLVTTLHSLTGTHRWYVQTYGGHDVLGSFYGVHSDLAGKVVKVDDGREAVSGAIPAAAVIPASAARAKATARGAVASLVVLPGHARLVWQVIDDLGVRTLVDATTGA